MEILAKESLAQQLTAFIWILKFLHYIVQHLKHFVQKRWQAFRSWNQRWKLIWKRWTMSDFVSQRSPRENGDMKEILWALNALRQAFNVWTKVHSLILIQLRCSWYTYDSKLSLEQSWVHRSCSACPDIILRWTKFTSLANEVLGLYLLYCIY